MKLNKNSIGVKIYQYVWEEDLPNNLCNYFWKSVLAYPLLPLVTIFQMMYYPASLIPFVKNGMEGDRFRERLGGAFLIITSFLLFCVGVFISSAWITYQSKTVMFEFYTLGGLFTFITTITTLSLLVIKVNKGEERVIIEYIKSKKGNYCPKIEWVEDEK